MNIRQTILPYCFFVLFFSCFIASSLVIKENRKNYGARYPLNITPVSPNIITLLAGEFRGLMADHILLEIGSFIGSNRKISRKQWEDVCLGFQQVQKLDPYFQQTYLMVQGLLTWYAKRYNTAVKILGDSREHRTWDWRPGYYMGFDYYYFLNNYSGASQAFLKAAMIRNAPPLLAVLGGRLAVKGKRVDAAIVMLQTMMDNSELDAQSKNELLERIEALKGISLIEKAIERYRKTYGRYPSALNILTASGMLAKLPKNPYSDRYYYNSKDGSVVFDKIRAKEYNRR